MKKTFVLFLPLLLSSCSSYYQQFEQSKLHHLVGKKESNIIELLGEPNEIVITSDDEKKFIYQTSYKNYTPAHRPVYLNGETNLQGTYTPSSCTTTFIIKNEIVSNVYNFGPCL